jgi:thiol:disulfide interchange protein DsbD
MKKFVLIGLVLASSLTSFSQSTKQVKWTFNAKKISEKVYEVTWTADINGNWHMYSQNAGDGPQPTVFTFTKNPLINLDGKVKEVGKMQTVYEEVFKSDVRFYESTVSFVQLVKVKGTAKTNLAGKVEFMVCNDKTCLPPAAVEFAINIGG